LNFSATDEGDGSVAKVSIGSLSVLGVGEVIAKTVGGELNGSGDADPSDLLELLAANPGDPGYDSIRLDDFDLDMSGVTLALPSYHGDVTRDQEGRAVRNQVQPFELTVNADPNGEMGSQLAGQFGLLGYESLVIGGAADSRIDHSNDLISADAHANYLELQDGFRLSFGGEFEGLSAFYGKLADGDIDDFGDDPDELRSTLSQLAVHGLQLSFDDDSFVDRAFSAAAAMDGGTPDELRSQLKLSLGLAPLMTSSMGIDPDIVTEFTTALGDFITKPGKLTLSLDPGSPITADMLEDPTQLTKDVLGFSASSN